MMASFIQFRRTRRSSTSSGYMELLSTLANDLDHMLSVLCTTPPPPYDRLTDNELHNRSEAYGNVDVTDPGTAIVGVKSTPINTETHRLDTDIYATKNIIHHSPITKGIDASYQHLPTKSNLDLSVVNTPQWGTDAKASGKYNFFQDKVSNANVEGFYSRHYGGLPGTGRPDYGVMFNYRRDF